MNSTWKIIRYQIKDVIRSKWIVFYFLLFLILTDGLFRFGNDGHRVILSLMNAVLLIIPLMSAVFGVMYLYGAREFIELMLSQPISRRSLFSGLYAGLSIPLVLAFIAGVSLPFLLHGSGTDGQPLLLSILITSGLLLTLIFTGLAFMIALRHENRIRGLGISLFNWVCFAVIYDGLILFLIYFFNGYPLEKPLIAATLANPVDLARVFLLLNLEAAALMGYTGAVFEQFFGSSAGFIIALTALIAWAVAPMWVGRYLFVRKDF